MPWAHYKRRGPRENDLHHRRGEQANAEAGRGEDRHRPSHRGTDLLGMRRMRAARLAEEDDAERLGEAGRGQTPDHCQAGPDRDGQDHRPGRLRPARR